MVVKFQAINPHMRLTLRVTDEKGTRDVELEGHSTNNMYRAGYRDGLIKVGDKITVNVAPLRDGSEGGYMVAAVTASGTRFGVQTAAERARERKRRKESRGRLSAWPRAAQAGPEAEPEAEAFTSSGSSSPSGGPPSSPATAARSAPPARRRG